MNEPVAGQPLDGLLDTTALLDALDTAQIGYAITDTDGHVLFASEPYRQIASVSEQRLATGLPWFELDLASDRDKAARAKLWDAFKRQSATWRGWVRWHLPSGRVRFFEGTAKPLPGQRVLLLANDRSDSIEADRALEESEDTLRLILDDLPVNVTLLSRDGIILYINHVLPNRLGVTPDDVIGHPFDAVGRINPDPEFSARLRQAIAEERRIDGVDVHLRGGTLAGTHWLFFGRPLYGRDGKMRRYLSVSVERTAERNLADERSRFAAALAESQKISALNDFAGSLAHELANVLQPVGVYARRLVKAPHDDEAPEYAARIEDAVRDAGRILKRTLSMARTEAGSNRPLDLVDIVGGVLDSARDLAPSALRYEAELPAEAFGLCQATELRQVLLNLLNNAAEAQDYEGTIRIEMSGPNDGPNSLAVAPTASGPFWRLDVIDRGAGMKGAVRARIFEPFFTTKMAGRGTGLGLPVVLGLATGWGGTVTVASKKDIGSTFTVWIPQGGTIGVRGEGTSEERLP